ncbi:hypothetical protein GCM10011611_03020 [Aliidongia dinghuensis]|uniref:Uncharacterized protein n=1 Tax=Aliidongia dinghuensis TaxID=1867774 RepID=A0A8J3E1D0_9PROT|nr:hypothetical protein [Aliidongia dinghuensis]GGF00851.1 hypothetical protein GCM10011611_03020 [Aliidongia dinghuensis]
MRRSRKRIIDDTVLAMGSVEGVDISVSFGLGRRERDKVVPWSEVISMEVTCRLTYWNYKGVDALKVTLYRALEFEDPAYVRDLEAVPLPHVGMLHTQKDLLRAFGDMPPWIFDSARATLTCGKPAYVLIHMTKPVRRRAWLRHLQFTTDRTELE